MSISNAKVVEFARIVHPYLKRSRAAVEHARRIAKKQGKAADWPWNRFIHAFATNGGSSHWEDEIESHYKRYSWVVVAHLSDAERKRRFFSVTNPRRRNRGSRAWFPAYLEDVFQRVWKAGGPQSVKRQYEKLRSPKDRMKFLMTFQGIGKKYAREIPMGSYDPLFRKHFAVDYRLNRLVTSFLQQTLSYSEAERFLGKVATELGVDCWTLDRTLYDAYDKLKKKIPTARI